MSAREQASDAAPANDAAPAKETAHGNEAAPDAEATADAPDVLEILDEAAEGEVLWYSVAKGYGFIEQDGVDEDIFVHYSELADPDNLITGDVVRYQLVRTDRGYQAQNVAILVEAEPLDPTP